MPEHWSVSVEVNGETVLTISSDELFGVEDVDRYAETIRGCAAHLLAFIGTGEEAGAFPPE